MKYFREFYEGHDSSDDDVYYEVTMKNSKASSLLRSITNSVKHMYSTLQIVGTLEISDKEIRQLIMDLQDLKELASRVE